MKYLISVLVLLCVVSSFVSAVGNDWPSAMRDTELTGISPDTLNTAGLSLRYSASGDSYFKPIITAGFLYTSDFGHIRKYDIDTGSLLLTYTTPSGVSIDSQVTYASAKLFFAGSDNKMYVVRADTMGQYCAGGPFASGWGIASQIPLVVGNSVIFSGNDHIWYAMSYATQGACEGASPTMAWTFNCDNTPGANAGSKTTYASAAYDGAYVYIGCVAKSTTWDYTYGCGVDYTGHKAYLRAVDPSTGDIAWHWFENPDICRRGSNMYGISVDGDYIYPKVLCTCGPSEGTNADTVYWVPKSYGDVIHPTRGTGPGNQYGYRIHGEFSTYPSFFVPNGQYDNDWAIAHYYCDKLDSNQLYCVNHNTNPYTFGSSLHAGYYTVPEGIADPALICSGNSGGYKCMNFNGGNTYTITSSAAGDAAFGAYTVGSTPYSYLAVALDSGNVNVYREPFYSPSTTTTTTIPVIGPNTRCFNVKEYGTDANLAGVGVLLVDKDDDYYYFGPTTPSTGVSCISSLPTDSINGFQLMVYKDGYDEYTIPLYFSDNTPYLTMSDLLPNEGGQYYVVRLNKDIGVQCRPDYPPYRMVCFTDNKGEIKYSVSMISSTSAGKQVYAGTFDNVFPLPDFGRLVFTFNEPQMFTPTTFDPCDLGEGWYYNPSTEIQTCVKTYLDLDWCMEWIGKPNPPAPCDPKLLMRARISSAKPTYKVTFTPTGYPAVSSKDTALLECYHDLDCEIGNCNLRLHRCESPWAISSFKTIYTNDRPTVKITWPKPLLYDEADCSPYFGCAPLPSTDMRYRIYRHGEVPDPAHPGQFISIDGQIPASKAIPENSGGLNTLTVIDDFSDVCPVTNSMFPCNNFIGVGATIEYDIGVLVNDGGWYNTQFTGVTGYVIENCDMNVADKKCQKWTCPGTPKGCGSTGACTVQTCAVQADCDKNCPLITNGGTYSSPTFCNLPEGMCRPKYKWCDSDSACSTTPNAQANGIYDTDPERLGFLCSTSGKMFCNKQFNAVDQTIDWSTGSAMIDYATLYSSETHCVCVRKSSGSCVDSGNCETNICSGGPDSAMGACQFYKQKKFYYENRAGCKNDEACYYYQAQDSGSGSCIRMGQCGSWLTCKRDTDAGWVSYAVEDGSCRDRLYALFGSLSDKNYAFCNEDNGQCIRASDRPNCNQGCNRDEWCRREEQKVCVGGVCGGSGCQGTTTTTTTLPKFCTHDSADCKFVTTIGSYSIGAPIEWKQDIDGKWMPCIDGRGCPTDTGTVGGHVKIDQNKQCVDWADPVTCKYIYTGCETYESDGFTVKTHGCGTGFFCSTDNKCYSLVTDGNICGGAGQTFGGKSGDIVCDSFNCVGDAHPQPTGQTPVLPRCRGYYSKCNSNADSSTPDSDIADAENYCHCEVKETSTGKGFSIGGPDNDPSPCTDIKGSRASAIAAVKNNQKWCQDGSLPNFKESNGFKGQNCYDRLDAGSACDESYQCKSGYSCIDGVCSGGDEKVPKGGICIIKNSQYEAHPEYVWNRLTNGESDETSIWSDNCDDGSEELYCDPCDHDKGTTDSRLDGVTCSGVSVAHNTKGVCRTAQQAEDWCYSNKQCDQRLIEDGDAYKQLICSGSGFCSVDSVWPNAYCKNKGTSYYNKKCIFKNAGGGCYHDAGTADNRFFSKSDDQCFVQQYQFTTGSFTSDSDMFCDDEHMCTTSSSTSSKYCEEFSTSEPVTHVLGKCVVNYCSKDQGIPYISSDCMRAPGYWDPVNPDTTHHHVAQPTIDNAKSLVYCDAVGGKSGSTSEGGQCRWRKEKGKPCIYDIECMSDYRCINSICGQSTCYSDSDCGSGQVCDGGYCRPKPTYGFRITPLNGLGKPQNTPFSGVYDFVVACNKKDYIYKYEADVTMRVKYKIESGDVSYFGDTKSVMGPTGTGMIPELCSYAGLSDNTKGSSGGDVFYIKKVTFIPVINGQDDLSLQITKNILVLSRSLNVRVIRCDGNYGTDPLAIEKCGGVDSAGNPYSRDSMILVQNNSINVNQVGTNYQTTTPDRRYIACDASAAVGEPFLMYLRPKISANFFPREHYAVVEDWKKAKYYKCVDEYGTVLEGSVLINPAEWIFNYEISSRTRLLLILIVLLGIPTLVLAGSRARRG